MSYLTNRKMHHAYRNNMEQISDEDSIVSLYSVKIFQTLISFDKTNECT